MALTSEERAAAIAAAAIEFSKNPILRWLPEQREFWLRVEVTDESPREVARRLREGA